MQLSLTNYHIIIIIIFYPNLSIHTIETINFILMDVPLLLLHLLDHHR